MPAPAPITQITSVTTLVSRSPGRTMLTTMSSVAIPKNTLETIRAQGLPCLFAHAIHSHSPAPISPKMTVVVMMAVAVLLTWTGVGFGVALLIALLRLLSVPRLILVLARLA